MPRRDDFLEAYWVLPAMKRRGDGPMLTNPPESIMAPIDAAQGKVRIHSTAERAKDIEPRLLPRRIKIHVRDRAGFQYTRTVGLNDYITVRVAAQLLHVPVMSVNRWVSAGELPRADKPKNGVVVVRLRDVREFAIRKGRKLRIGVFTEGEGPWLVG